MGEPSRAVPDPDRHQQAEPVLSAAALKRRKIANEPEKVFFLNAAMFVLGIILLVVLGLESGGTLVIVPVFSVLAVGFAPAYYTGVVLHLNRKLSTRQRNVLLVPAVIDVIIAIALIAIYH